MGAIHRVRVNRVSISPSKRKTNIKRQSPKENSWKPFFRINYVDGHHKSINNVIKIKLKHPFFGRNPYFLLNEPHQDYHQSIDNEIVHLTQLTRDRT